MPETSEERLEKIALNYFDHIERQIQLVATKATILLAAAALVLGVYIKYATDNDIFPVATATKTAVFLFFLSGGLLLWGLLAALIAIWPRTTVDKPSALFYGWVATVDENTFRTRFKTLENPEDLYEELLERIRGKAVWLLRMYRWLRVSLFCLIAGSTSSVLIIAFLGDQLGVKKKSPAVQEEAMAQVEIVLEDMRVANDVVGRRKITVDCGQGDEQLIGKFRAGEFEKLEESTIESQLNKVFVSFKKHADNRNLYGLIIVGSADKRHLSRELQKIAGTNDRLAQMRAASVKKQLELQLEKQQSIKPQLIMSLNPELARVRLVANGKRFDAERSVQVCAAWEN
jgi:hypothetical protein